MCELCQKFLADQRSIAAGGVGTHDFLDDPEHPTAPVKKPVDSSVAGGTDTGLAERDQIIEEFAEMPQAVPQSEWKRLGIGYGPLSGQVFPEACAFELSEIGPQGEPVFRFNENHDEKGQFTSGSSMTAAGDTGRWDVSGDHAEFGETNKSRLEDGYTIVKVPSDKVHVDTVYPDRVKQYAEQMGKGAKFPMPTGKTDDGGKTFWVANGNHRVAAAKSLGDEHIYLVVKNRELAGKRTAPMYGPQGEPLWRYSEDQPRDPDGKFASGGGEQTKADRNAIQAWGYDKESLARLQKSDEFGEALDRNPDRYNGAVCRGTVMSELQVAQMRESRELEFTKHQSATAKENDEFAQIAATEFNKGVLAGGSVPVVLELRVKDVADVGQQLYGAKGMEVIIKSGTTFKIGNISAATFHNGQGTEYKGYRIHGEQK